MQTWEKSQFFPPIPARDTDYSIGRLTVFRNKKTWLTVFQIIQYHYSTNQCENDIFAYGNSLKKMMSLHTLRKLLPLLASKTLKKIYMEI